MICKRAATALTGGIAAVLAIALSIAAAQPAAEPPFGGEIHVFGVEDEIFPPAPCSTLFVGSSSIRFWFSLAQDFPSRKIIRRGYGGSTIADTNFYFDRIVAPYRPREIVFYASENDIDAGMAPAEVMAELQTFLEKKTAALGDTPVYFISIKPSKARISEIEQQTAANALVSKLAEERADLIYVDVAGPMMDNGAPKDIFISDNLHMNREGYAIWRDVIGGALKKSRKLHAPECR